MEKLTQILTSSVAAGIGWSLIHATWQITILVLSYVGVKLFTQKSAVRYWSGIGLLFAQIPISIITFFFVYAPSVRSTSMLGSIEMALQLSISEQITIYLNAHIDLIFGLWFLGISLLLLKLGINYFIANGLKYSKLNKYNFTLVELLSNVKEPLGIKRVVEIYETKAVSVPMIIGTLKPVVLIPASLLSGLSTEQLEIVIAHELAHLKRYDFMLNILQSFVEILFFFHPALWLLSAEIRKEREYCCDETAMQVNGDRLLLVKTLASIQESSQMLPLAMAFGRKKMGLLERVQHILGVNQKQSHAKESLWLLGGLMIVFMAFSQGKISESVDNKGVSESKESDVPIHVQKAFLKMALGDIADTTRESSSSNKTTLWNENHEVVIDGERILIDGKEQPLTPEQKQVLRKNYAALKASEAKMQSHIREFESKSVEMEKYARQIEDNVKPMEEVAKRMEDVGRQMEAVVQKYEPKLSSKKSTIEEIEELSKKMEVELYAYEVQMKDLDKQMEAVELQMDKNVELHMQATEKQMQIHEAPLEQYGEEMEGYMYEIRMLLPKEIREELMSFPAIAPPPPPSAPRVSPPSPPRQPSPPKSPSTVNPPKPPTPKKVGYGLKSKPYFYLPVEKRDDC